jgi:hypothetical protein
MDGWNGHVCQNPSSNTYCVGSHSYPGEMISERRNLPLELVDAGRCCTKIKHIPACCYSINAFGAKTIKAFSDPPDFFKDDTLRAEWELAPATVCLWPYEVMYGDDVKDGAGYDYEQRLANAREYFSQFKEDAFGSYAIATVPSARERNGQRGWKAVCNGCCTCCMVGDGGVLSAQP